MVVTTRLSPVRAGLVLLLLPAIIVQYWTLFITTGTQDTSEETIPPLPQIHIDNVANDEYAANNSIIASTLNPKQNVNTATAATTTMPARSSPSSSSKVCNDTALYYNSMGKIGIYSRSKTQTVAAALNSTDINVIWHIFNWISTPSDGGRCENHVLRSIRTLSPPVPHINVTKLLITDSDDLGSGFHIRGYELNTCLRKASEILGAENVHLASRALVKGRRLSCFRAGGKCRNNTPLGGLNGTVLDYRNSTVSSYVHNGESHPLRRIQLNGQRADCFDSKRRRRGCKVGLCTQIRLQGVTFKE